MNRSIMITGASSGIGAALAAELARRGWRLALAARRLEALEAVQKRLTQGTCAPQVEIARLDVTEYGAVATVIETLAGRLGGLDVVMANAGIGTGEKIGRGAFDRARRTVEVNLVGAMATVDAAVSYFQPRGGGHIVGTSSVSAFRGTPRSSSYAASKAGLAVYLETLRAEALRENIDVTVLYPGYIDTPLNEMLPFRPFLISSEKGAKLIADAIEKRKPWAFIPRFPWNVVARLLRILPTSVVAKL